MNHRRLRCGLGVVLLLCSGLLYAAPPNAPLATPLAPAAQQTLHLGNGPEPETLDPQRSESVSSGNIVRDLYEGLTLLSPSGAVVPGSAERWQISADGRTYTFTLRAHARWSDGSPLTAADFVAGLQRSVAPATGSAYAQMLAPLHNAAAISAGKAAPSTLGAVALDAHTLQLQLNAATPYFLGLLTHPSSFPVHRPSLARWGKDFARVGRLVGNGAFTLAEWREQSHLTLHRNPYYWNAAATQLQAVTFHTSEDIQTALSRYRTNELDTTYEIPLDQAPALRAEYGTQLHIGKYLGSYFYGFNCSQAPFTNNPKLRAALTLAVDREVIVRKVMNGLALPVYGLVPLGTGTGYSPPVPEWAHWPRAQRLAEARRLYAQAGYSAAQPLHVQLRYNSNEDHRRIAVVIAAMWKQWLGVETTLINEEFKVFIQNRRQRKVTQVFRSVWIADYNDASAFTGILHSAHGKNDSVWHNPAYDALLAQAATQPDASARSTTLQQAERLIQTDWPVLPIYGYVSKHLVKPWVAGWQDNVLDYHYSKDLAVLAH